MSEKQKGTIQIEYDDDALSIIEKVNELLRERGLAIESDGLEHDGFEILSLKDIQP